MLNISRRTTGVLSIVLCSALTACVVAPPQQQAYSTGNVSYQGRPDRNAAPYGTEYARVSRIEAPEPQYGQGQQASGVGAVVGAVIGGVLGNRFGHGGGRAVATGIGVVSGAVIGNTLEGGNGAPPSNALSYRVILQMDRGDTQSYYVPTPGDLRPGDRVRVYDGQISRY